MSGLYQAIDKQKVFEGTLVAFEEDELTMEYMDKTRKKTVQIPIQFGVKSTFSSKIIVKERKLLKIQKWIEDE